VVINSYVCDLKHKEDELALQYLPAVRAMAFRLKERLPSSVDYLDLAAIGTEELIKLARRYNDDLNDSFWGYAKKRVYGAMLDYLRSLDVMRWANRKLVKAIDYAIENHRALHDDEPSDEQLAELLGEDLEKIHEARVASSIYGLLPLQDQLHLGDEGASLEKIENDELIEKIKALLAKCSQREQLVMQLYYFEELNLKEISEVLNITESRISQIHKAIIQKIRASVI
jgi:RNA polymerase sigma factor for flagellar operon FliA